MNKSIIVIGAGAAGLITAATLSKAGYSVTILEARERIGGRAFTYSDNQFTQPVEMGAEFIHGNLPLSLQLLKQYNIAYERTAGKAFEVVNGKWQQSKMFDARWDDFIQHLQSLQEDDSIANVLQKQFSTAEFTSLREAVTHYVEGYDAADTKLASAKAFLEEWQNEEDAQYRITGGYHKLLHALEKECLQYKTSIQLNNAVQHIQWHANRVEVHTTNENKFTADRAVITVPLGVLQADALSAGAISFAPALAEKMEAAQQLGFGSVVKILVEFNQQFWQQLQSKNVAVHKAGFIFSEQAVPTWWSQLPNNAPVLTGWLAGPKAPLLLQVSNEAILQQALQSLAAIFTCSVTEIQQNIIASKVLNWGAETYSKGAYTFPVVNSLAARKKLAEPVENTLFFAGEACFDGHETGTVEAALQSGKNVAEQIMRL